MSTTITAHDAAWTVTDLVERFGPILLSRIRWEPSPGTATEQDVIDIHNRESRLFELVDGVLVEKAMGIQESFVAIVIAQMIGNFSRAHKLGIVLGADGMARLSPGLVRIPDVSFVRWDRLPGNKVPAVPMLDLAPDLAVEVLSPSNTKREMDQKLVDYFEAGVEQVWYVDPRERTLTVFTAPTSFTVLDVGKTLDGVAVLPGFSLAVKDLFSELETQG